MITQFCQNVFFCAVLGLKNPKLFLITPFVNSKKKLSREKLNNGKKAFSLPDASKNAYIRDGDIEDDPDNHLGYLGLGE